MTAYYKNEVTRETMEVITSGYFPGLSQEGDGIDGVVISLIPQIVMSGGMVLFHEGNIVYMLRRKTAWVGQVDIFIGKEGSVKEAIAVGRKAIKWAAENTFFHKLEARSPLRTMPILAKRLGFEIEGYRKQSFKTQDGEMLDEVEAGLVLRSQSCKSH